MNTYKIALVVGETSGDILGAGLVKALQERGVDVEIEGIAGPRLESLGVKSLYDMDRLAVMGIAEVFGRLRELLKIRRNLVNRWQSSPPDLFIGIDAPDFNLGLEKSLKEAGIKTVHYVSPSVWAWRQRRVKKIAQSVDKILTLFPFETDLYRAQGVDVHYVGHTMADDIPFDFDKDEAKSAIGLSSEDKVLALLPGSRSTELKYLTLPFCLAVNQFKKIHPSLKVVVPFVNDKRRQQFKAILQKHGVAFDYIDVDSGRAALSAADGVLLASGTAALEACLLKVPMVAAYKISSWTAPIIRKLLKSPFVTLPNVLSKKMVIPELLQEQVTPEGIYTELVQMMDDENIRLGQVQAFSVIHEKLRCNADQRAADAVEGLLTGDLS